MLRYVLNAYSFLLCNFMIRKDRWTNENRPNKRKIINLDTGEIFESVAEAGRKYNVASTNICRVLKGKMKTCKGCRWMYYDDYMSTLCQAS